METIEYRTADKSAWGDGPWQDEPDKKQWQDVATGLPCLIVRNLGGSLCGYVGVSSEHPLHGRRYNARVTVPDRESVPLGENERTIALFLEAMHEDDGCVALDCLIDVHGGLNYAEHCCPHKEGESRGVCHKPAAGEPDDVWWFGFDCAHAWDVSPAHDWSRAPDSSYRSFRYVTMQVESLARQLKSLEESQVPA